MYKFDATRYMSTDEIMDNMRSFWKPIPEIESVAVTDALGRVPAHDVLSEIDIPVSRGAACDGIAVRSSDFANGTPDTSSWTAKSDYAIVDMGDDFDDRFDAVIAVEDVDMSNGTPLLSKDVAVRTGDLLEPKGGTVYRGGPLARAGRRLSPLHLANLTTAGIASLDVLKKPRTAFIPTGNELISPGELPVRGQFIDCNSTMAKVMLSGWGSDVELLPIVRDVPGELSEVLDQALASCDIVLINGGSSKGKDDFCPELIKRGAVFYNHHAKIRPGRPIVTAVRGNKPVINIPGPAFSAFFPMCWCVLGLIEHWFGLQIAARPTITARAGSDFALDDLDIDYGLFFRVEITDGIPTALPLDEQVRGDLFMSADSYAILPAGSRGFREGDPLSLTPIY